MIDGEGNVRDVVVVMETPVVVMETPLPVTADFARFQDLSTVTITPSAYPAATSPPIFQPQIKGVRAADRRPVQGAGEDERYRETGEKIPAGDDSLQV
ncbi:hypothetical protein ACHWQZ_G018237 [Mnemiopsis leidyi]